MSNQNKYNKNANIICEVALVGEITIKNTSFLRLSH